MVSVTCGLTAEDRDQLWKPMLVLSMGLSAIYMYTHTHIQCATKLSGLGHLVTDRASNFGAKLSLECVNDVRVVTLTMFVPSLFSNDLRSFTNSAQQDAF